jgi:hypothetical protein
MKNNCRKCGIVLTDENTKKYRLKKKDYVCNDCGRIEHKISRRKCYKNPEKRRKFEETTLKWRVSHPDKVKATSRRMVCKRRGISVKEFDSLYLKQKGCCAICKKHSSQLKRTLNIDHDHKTGRIRGLLCNPCNLRLGTLEDENFRKAVENYLGDL